MFPDLFCTVDFWKFSMLLLSILWDDWQILKISGSNEQLQKKMEYTLLKPNCRSWWISKMQSDTLEERYATNYILNLKHMPQKRMECFRLLFEHLAWIEYQRINKGTERHKRFKKGTESVRDDEKCGRSKEVNTPELIDQRVRVRVTILRF